MKAMILMKMQSVITSERDDMKKATTIGTPERAIKVEGDPIIHVGEREDIPPTIVVRVMSVDTVIPIDVAVLDEEDGIGAIIETDTTRTVIGLEDEVAEITMGAASGEEGVIEEELLTGITMDRNIKIVAIVVTVVIVVGALDQENFIGKTSTAAVVVAGVTTKKNLISNVLDPTLAVTPHRPPRDTPLTIVPTRDG